MIFYDFLWFFYVFLMKCFWFSIFGQHHPKIIQISKKNKNLNAFDFLWNFYDFPVLRRKHKKKSQKFSLKNHKHFWRFYENMIFYDFITAAWAEQKS